MSRRPLGQLADEVGVHERTLRRALDSGLIHAQRLSPRRIALADSEAEWVRAHWSLIGRLRAALRTEPNVALAVLFGSVARGSDVPGSDVDVLVDLKDSVPGALQALSRRLAERLDADVQLVPLSAARRDSTLLLEVLHDGRPLVDRGERWQSLQGHRQQFQEQADMTERALHDEARAAIDYFQKLAAERSSSRGAASG